MTAMVAMHMRTAATVFTASALDSSSVMLAGEVTGDVMETFCGEGSLINISGHQEKQGQNPSGGGNHFSPAPARALLAYPKKLKRTARRDGNGLARASIRNRNFDESGRGMWSGLTSADRCPRSEKVPFSLAGQGESVPRPSQRSIKLTLISEASDAILAWHATSIHRSARSPENGSVAGVEQLQHQGVSIPTVVKIQA
jgi:hypothetical protein